MLMTAQTPALCLVYQGPGVKAPTAGEFARGQRREHICTGQGAKTLPEVCPLYVAHDQLQEMTGGEVYVYQSDDHCSEWVKHEGR